jgi:SagB-type dehydrogenase family enzyme
MPLRHFYLLAIITGLSSLFCACAAPSTATPLLPTPGKKFVMKLPEPRIHGETSVEEVLSERRSVRGYQDEPITLGEVSQLLWAAQGITDTYGRRTAPSAGGLYPLEVYLISGHVTGLPSGIYHYIPGDHSIVCVVTGDRRPDLTLITSGQSFVSDAPVSFVITAVYERTVGRYGSRGIRYADMEAGHAAQNLLLEGVALGIGAVTVGAFDDGEMGKLLQLPADETPLYIIPAGKK